MILFYVTCAADAFPAPPPSQRCRDGPVATSVQQACHHTMSFASGADLSNIFRVVNFGTGVLCVLGGISQFFPIGFQSSIIAIYVILFGVGIAALEVQVPPFTYKYASFLFSFLGRGLFYIFVGTILLHDHWLRIVAGVLISVIGLAYVALEFVPSVELPENMKPENHSGDYDNATDTI